MTIPTIHQSSSVGEPDEPAVSVEDAQVHGRPPEPTAIQQRSFRHDGITVTLPRGLTVSFPSEMTLSSSGPFPGREDLPVHGNIGLSHLGNLQPSLIGAGRLSSDTTRLGWAGVDCQPCWGQDLAVVLVCDPRRGDAPARPMSVDDLSRQAVSLVQADEDPPAVYVAHLVSSWRHDETSSESRVTRVQIEPLRDFIARWAVFADVDDDDTTRAALCLGKSYGAFAAFPNGRGPADPGSRQIEAEAMEGILRFVSDDMLCRLVEVHGRDVTQYDEILVPKIERMEAQVPGSSATWGIINGPGQVPLSVPEVKATTTALRDAVRTLRNQASTPEALQAVDVVSSFVAHLRAADLLDDLVGRLGAKGASRRIPAGEQAPF